MAMAMATATVIKLPLPCPLLVEITSPITNPQSTNPWSPINDPQLKNHKHWSMIHKHRSSRPTATSSQKCFLCLCWCVCVWVCLIFDWFCGLIVIGLFDFRLILWCACVVVIGGAGLWWWCLALLSCSDVGGGARSVYLAVGVIICRDYGLKRES